MNDHYDWPWVESQVESTIAVWNGCASVDAPKLPNFTPAQQRGREKAYDQALRAVEREIKRAPRTRADRTGMQQRLMAIVPRFASAALGLDDNAIELLTHHFLPVGTQLARWTRCFDPALCMADTIQACRNAFTACGLQPLMGEPMALTPSSLAYSLLYPYTDNYLDREDLSPERKIEFSHRFRSRLRGDALPPRNPHEAAIWALVELIEEQYSRAAFPRIFECLLAIHRAQENSIAQLDRHGFDPAQALTVSCAKGGTSVLANACLSHGDLSRDESRFAFEWGVLLQLGDDLQDLRDDLQRGSVTLFTHAARQRLPLDSLVTQLLNFSDRVASRMDNLPHASKTLKDLLRMSWRSLILMAVANTQEFFSPAFLAQLERTSPFSLSFQRARHEKLMGRNGFYTLLFDSFVEGEKGGYGPLPLPDGRIERSLHADAAPTALACVESAA